MYLRFRERRVRAPAGVLRSHNLEKFWVTQGSVLFMDLSQSVHQQGRNSGDHHSTVHGKEMG